MSIIDFGRFVGIALASGLAGCSAANLTSEDLRSPWDRVIGDIHPQPPRAPRGPIAEETVSPRFAVTSVHLSAKCIPESDPACARSEELRLVANGISLPRPTNAFGDRPAVAGYQYRASGARTDTHVLGAQFLFQLESYGPSGSPMYLHRASLEFEVDQPQRSAGAACTFELLGSRLAAPAGTTARQAVGSADRFVLDGSPAGELGLAKVIESNPAGDRWIGWPVSPDGRPPRLPVPQPVFKAPAQLNVIESGNVQRVANDIVSSGKVIVDVTEFLVSTLGDKFPAALFVLAPADKAKAPLATESQRHCTMTIRSARLHLKSTRLMPT